VFTSSVFDDLPRPDYCDLHAVPRPAGSPDDPEVWARTMFSPAGTPRLVGALLLARQALVPLMGIPRADAHEVFRIRRVVGDEALITTDDVHLDFRVALGVGPELVRCTTAVRIKNRRGRVYFAPVALAHGPVVEAMLRRTARVLTPGRGTSAAPPRDRRRRASPPRPPSP
jgi:hypothetical protein